jgi:hypothetical protein
MQNPGKRVRMTDHHTWTNTNPRRTVTEHLFHQVASIIDLNNIDSSFNFYRALEIEYKGPAVSDWMPTYLSHVEVPPAVRAESFWEMLLRE